MKTIIRFTCLLLSITLTSNSFSQLNGAYTIDNGGAASASLYEDIQSAVDDLSGNPRTDGGTANGPGVSGAVVFNIAAGTYIEEITINSIYNNIYSGGSVICDWLGTECAGLGTWQTLSGHDANSISVNPLYNDSVDLHVSQPLLDNSGLNISGISDDIDGQSRENPPYIGADEITAAPVEWLEISAAEKGGEHIIQWKTASENNNDYFTVEKSPDAKNWREATRINGAGTSENTHYYNYTDNYPFTGITYYRIKQTDFNNISGYSETVSLTTNNTTADVAVFPNPASDYINVQYDAFNSGSIVIISDVYGRIYYYGVNNTKYLRINTTNLPQGLYYITIRDDMHGVKEKILIE